MLLMSTLTLAPGTSPGNTAVSYQQHPPEGAFDAIVIGSGMGGLASAALLAQRAGKRVLVLERHYTAGGFTHVFHRPGYEWDVGVHYIGQMGAGPCALCSTRSPKGACNGTPCRKSTTASRLRIVPTIS